MHAYTVRLTICPGARFGLHLNDANRVVRLDADGLAAADGKLQPGDTILSVNGVSVARGAKVVDVLKRDGTLRADGGLQDGRTVVFQAARAAEQAPPPADGAPPPLPPQLQQTLTSATGWLRSRLGGGGAGGAGEGAVAEAAAALRV